MVRSPSEDGVQSYRTLARLRAIRLSRLDVTDAILISELSEVAIAKLHLFVLRSSLGVTDDATDQAPTTGPELEEIDRA